MSVPGTGPSDETGGMLNEALTFLEQKTKTLLGLQKTEGSMRSTTGALHHVTKGHEEAHFFKFGDKFQDWFNDVLMSPSLKDLVGIIKDKSSDKNIDHLSPEQQLYILKGLKNDLDSALAGRQKMMSRLKETSHLIQRYAHQLLTLTSRTSLKKNFDEGRKVMLELNEKIAALEIKVASQAEKQHVTPEATPRLQRAKTDFVIQKSNLRTLGEWNDILVEMLTTGDKLKMDAQHKVVCAPKKDSKSTQIVDQLISDLERIQENNKPNETEYIIAILQKLDNQKFPDPNKKWINAVINKEPALKQRLDTLKAAVDYDNKVAPGPSKEAKTREAGEYLTAEALINKLIDPQETDYRERFIYGVRSVFSTTDIIALLANKMSSLQSPAQDLERKILHDITLKMMSEGVFQRSECELPPVEQNLKILLGEDWQLPSHTTSKRVETASESYRGGPKKSDFDDVIAHLATADGSDRPQHIRAAADEITRFLSTQFKQVKPAEFYGQPYTKSELAAQCPHLINMAKLSNVISLQLIKSLYEPNLTKKERAKRVEALIDLQYELYKRGNFFAASAILAALQQAHIQRQKESLQLISPHHQRIAKMLESQLGHESNFKNYKKQIATYDDRGALPLLHVLQGNYTFLEEGLKNKGGKYNLQRIQLAGDLFKRFNEQIGRIATIPMQTTTIAEAWDNQNMQNSILQLYKQYLDQPDLDESTRANLEEQLKKYQTAKEKGIDRDIDDALQGMFFALSLLLEPREKKG